MPKYTLILLIVAVIISCSNPKDETKDEALSENIIELTEAQLKNTNISTSKLEQKTISSILKVNGTIDVPPQNMVSISIPLGGYLKSTKLLPGTHVNKGEEIAIMEDQQYISIQQEYLTAKSKLEFIEAEFFRQEELNKSKASSDKVFQQAKSDYTSQKILVKSLSEKLKLIGINPETLNETSLSRSIKIVSPINGYITKVNANIGKYVNPSDILFEMVNPTDIHLALYVFEKDIDKLNVGQKLVAYTNSTPEKKHACEIILIGRELSQERNVVVHCHFDKYDKGLLPGMFMNAEIEVNNNNAYVIASDAIVHFEGKDYIFETMNQNTFQLIEVKTSVTENNLTQITLVNDSEIASKSFVTQGAYTLLMAMKNKGE